MYRNTIQIKTDSPDWLAPVLLEVLDNELRSNRARMLETDGEDLCFSAGLFRWGRWKLLAGITRGALRVARTDGLVELHYDVSFAQLYIFSGVLSLVVILATLAAGLPLAISIALIAFFGLSSIGLNVLSAKAFFDRFLRGCIRKSRNRIGEPAK